uniref:Proliferating cell nuclear antigen PCNA N-terminal domain-containing protein n=1 Tax=viral metagenome TaxID=1070528 RepID=A0A6C0C1D3_9ZZZZ
MATSSTRNEEAAQRPQLPACGEDEPSAKHQKKDLFIWQARFAQCVTFKTFIENISNVLTEGHFTIVNKEDGFQGIETDSMDPNRIALVQGRLTAAVEGEVTESNSTFCIKMQNMLTCMRNAHAQHFLDLWRPKDSTDVVLHVYEPDVNTYTPTFKLRTLAKDADSIRLHVMDYKILVEIDLQTFRNAIKTAKDHKTESVDLRVLTPRVQRGSRVTTFFVIKYESDEVKSIFPYQSVTEVDAVSADPSRHTSNPLCIRVSENIAGDYDAIPSEEDLEVLYSARFAVDYLFLFVKGMDRSGITLRLSPDLPLIIDYPLGCSNTDYVRFVLAPKLAD